MSRRSRRDDRREARRYAWTRIAIRRKLRRGGVTNDVRHALEVALYDDDILEAALAEVDDDVPTLAESPDWTGFFEALGNFLEKIIPLILKLIEAIGGGITI